MEKTEQELEDELTKLKLKHQTIKKGKIRYNNRVKKAICISTILVVLLIISYISFNQKNFYLKDVKKNVSVNTNLDLQTVDEIEIKKDGLKLNFLSNNQNIILKKGNTNNKLVVKGNEKPNIYFNRGVFEINFSKGPIILEVPSMVKEITIMDLLNKGVIFSGLNLENLSLDTNYINEKSTVKIENSIIKNINVKYNLGNVYLCENSMVENFSITSLMTNIILVEKSKVKNFKTDVYPGTIFYFKNVKIKEIITNQNKFKYDKSGDTIYMDNNREYTGRNIIVK